MPVSSTPHTPRFSTPRQCAESPMRNSSELLSKRKRAVAAGLLPEHLYRENVAAVQETAARVQQCRDRLQGKSGLVHAYQADLARYNNKLRSSTALRAECASETSRHIRERMDELRKLVDAKEAALLADLADIRSEAERATETAVQGSLRKSDELTQVVSEVNKLLRVDNLAPQDFTAQASEVEQLLDERLQQRAT